MDETYYDYDKVINRWRTIKMRSATGTGRDWEILVSDDFEENCGTPIVVRYDIREEEKRETVNESKEPALTPTEQRLVQTKRKIQL